MKSDQGHGSDWRLPWDIHERIMLDLKDQRKTILDIARERGVSPSTVRRRAWALGMTAEQLRARNCGPYSIPVDDTLRDAIRTAADRMTLEGMSRALQAHYGGTSGAWRKLLERSLYVPSKKLSPEKDDALRTFLDLPESGA